MKTSDEFLQDYAGCACFQFRRLSRLITAAYDDQLRGTGLKASQIAILAHLAAGMTESAALEDGLALERTALLRAFQPLLRQGWIEVQNPVSGRALTYHITADGLELLRKIYPRWTEAQKRVTRSFGKGKWPMIEPLLAASGQNLARTS